MKTKNMKRTDWRRLLEKSYAVRDCAPWGYPGRESILRIHKVSQPLWVKEGYGRICIADAGHSWVQVACHGQPYWLTAMFDRKDCFLQIYFDIARPPCFDDPDDPTFEDLYLDVVLTSKLELAILDREELEEALKIACAWEFVNQFPEGLEHRLSAGGRGVSEGQAQRLAIARALVRKAPVLLLDEVTSALDRETEQRVLQNLVRRGLTTVVITHRLSVLGLCGGAYRVEGGKVTALTAEELAELAK